MNKQISELDGLRGWMALWVWVAHVSSMAMLPLDVARGPGWIIANGEYAVGVFIILSGFVISMTLSDASAQPTRAFYVRRVFRLFPAYWICLTVSAFVILDLSITTLQTLPWYSPRTVGRLLYLTRARDEFWTHLALHVPLLHGVVPQRFLPATSYAFIGQAWSLTLEWQFYLIAPLAFAFVRRIEWTPLRQAGLLLVLAWLARRVSQISMLPSHLYLFVIGYFSYALYAQRNAKQLSLARFCAHVGVWALCAALVSDRWLALLVWTPVLYGMIATAPPRAVTALQHILRLRISAGLGAISYSFYCSHMIFVYGCAYTLLVLLGVRDKSTYAIALIVSSLAGSLLFSAALHAFVEKPCIALGRRAAAQRTRPE